MKKSLLILLAVLLLQSLGCTYEPPEGALRQFHDYDAALAYARTIDPAADVSREYQDLSDEYGRGYRQWDAVILDTPCHVASVERAVFNSGFLGGEFSRIYCCMDSDIGFFLIQSLLREQAPGWHVSQDTPANRYHNNDLVLVTTDHGTDGPLDDAELDRLWDQACRLREAYDAFSLPKELWVDVPSPTLWHREQGDFLRMGGTSITDFTPEGKETFLEAYRRNWAYLDQGYELEK